MEILSFCTCVTKMTIIWSMVPEMWSETDGNFCHFGPFLPFQPSDNPENQNFKTEKNTWIYCHFTHLHHKWQSYDVGSWDMECDRIFFIILDHFLPFYSPMDPENQNFEKMKKTPEDIIILHIYTINDSHMCGSWDMKCNGHNFLSFWTIFCPFTLLTTWKINILKKWKKLLQIIWFHTCVA